jgi:hypothetical protein
VWNKQKAVVVLTSEAQATQNGPVYWLLLWCGIVQSVLCSATFSDLLCVPISNLVIPHLSTRALWLKQRHLEAKQGELSEKCRRILPIKYLCHTPQRYFNMPLTSNDMGPSALLALWRKSYFGLLLPLNIHFPLPGLKQRTLSLMASTITTRLGMSNWWSAGSMRQAMSTYAARGKVSRMWICYLGRVLIVWAELSDSQSKRSLIIAYAILRFTFLFKKFV